MEWIRKAQNVILAGPIGTGKTHLAIAIGVEAAKQRFHVAFLRAADFVRNLVEARDQRELGRLQRRLGRVDLLIIDELGFVPFDPNWGRARRIWPSRNGRRSSPSTRSSRPRCLIDSEIEQL